MGRVAGTPNRATTAVRQKITMLMERYTVDQMISDLMEISAKDRLWVLHGLAEFVAPKLARVEVEENQSHEVTIKIVHDRIFLNANQAGSNGSPDPPALESAAGSNGQP